MKSTTGVLQLIKILRNNKPVNREALGKVKNILQNLVSNKGEHAGVARFVKNNPDNFFE